MIKKIRPMFRRLLIANRGEIACRIMRTAKRMQIETIAVYSEADRYAPHVKMADHAIYIGGAASEESYLNYQTILNAAQKTQADAIHPGYGFLSENPLFAEACVAQGITFIGPSPYALKVMGSKQQAKNLLLDSTVPLIPGYQGQEQSDKALLSAAKKIGFPLLLKAAAGGGGKGMRIVHDAQDFFHAIAATKREAQAYFGEDTLIIEKYIPEARHVEVQIIGDLSGEVMALFDRDCSIQRRHQKIIEEAPAPNISEACRKRLYAAACDVGKLIDYVGAGTIEFLLDKDENFYFMEMNTRLQVEHPVTEAITQIDLVEWQLRVATGETLLPSLAQIQKTGHAIECRIYAEDPYQNFLPSVGEIRILSEPKGTGIRVDSGYDSFDHIPSVYDAMISKVITHGKTREEAIFTMQQALANYHIAMVATNLSFLQSILSEPHFLKAELSTNFLEHHLPTPKAPVLSDEILYLLFTYYYLSTVPPAQTLDFDTFGWHPFLTQRYPQTFEYHHPDKSKHPYEATLFFKTARILQLQLEDETVCNIHVIQTDPELIIEVNHSQIKGRLALLNDLWHCFYQGNVFIFNRLKTESEGHQRHTQDHAAPMPGKVVALLKQPGDLIEANEGVLIMEAMKMEHTIRAAYQGEIEEIFYKPGDQVTEGSELFTLKDIHAPKKRLSD